MLYELLSGKRAFGGKTVTDTLAKILEGVPDWEALPENTPWRIQELLHRCLTKDAHDRLRDIATVRIEVKLALEEPATELPTGTASTVQPARQRWGMTVGLVVLGAIVTGLAVWSLVRSTPQVERLSRFVITPPSTAPLSNSNSPDAQISPDGSRIAYATLGSGSTRRLYTRPLDGLMATSIPGTEAARPDFFFSPDGQSLAFFTDRELKKVSLAGGPAPYALPGLHKPRRELGTRRSDHLWPAWRGSFASTSRGGQPTGFNHSRCSEWSGPPMARIPTRRQGCAFHDSE